MLHTSLRWTYNPPVSVEVLTQKPEGLRWSKLQFGRVGYETQRLGSQEKGMDMFAAKRLRRRKNQPDIQVHT